MGLDSFWEHPDRKDSDDLHPKFDPPLKLCGGVFSGNGAGSFRGKVYAQMLQDITGVNIYQELIDNSIIKEMARDLEEWVADDGPEDCEPALHDLKRMFRAYADAGYELVGWW